MGDEGFVMVNGKKEDSYFHREVFDYITPESVREDMRKYMREAGYSEELIASFYTWEDQKSSS